MRLALEDASHATRQSQTLPQHPRNRADLTTSQSLSQGRRSRRWALLPRGGSLAESRLASVGVPSVMRDGRGLGGQGRF